MRHDPMCHALRLMLLLTEGHGHTVPELCQRLAMSQRNAYYYLEALRHADGIVLTKQGHRYSIDPSSPYLLRLCRAVSIAEDEAIAMRRLIDRAGDDSLQLRHLRAKLQRLHDPGILADVELTERQADMVSTLYEAMKTKNVVVIHNYSSPHSNTVSSRVVEPFMFLDNNNEVRCYEISTRMNKTFKIARMGRVEMLLDPWRHEHRHKRVFTDVFNFSGDERHSVCLRLDRLAHDVLMEEYPQAADSTQPDGPRHWLLRTDVCSYAGIGRFAMGLCAHVQVLSDDGLRQHIAERMAQAMATLSGDAP